MATESSKDPSFAHGVAQSGPTCVPGGDGDMVWHLSRQAAITVDAEAFKNAAALVSVESLPKSFVSSPDCLGTAFGM